MNVVVKAMDSRSRGRGLSPGAIYWMENCFDAMKENGENKGSKNGANHQNY